MKNIQTLKVLLVLILFAISIAVACKKEITDPAPDLSDVPEEKAHEIIDEYITSLEIQPQAEESHTLVSEKDSVVTELLSCRVEVYEDVYSKEAALLPNPAQPFLPGEVFELNSLYNGENKKKRDGRQGSRININLSTGPFSVSDTVSPDESAILGAISNLQMKIPEGDISQDVKIELKEAFSSSQIRAQTSFGGGSLFNSFEAELGFESNKFAYKYVAMIRITDFTVSVEDPYRPSEWFPSLKDLSSMGQWSPVYVKSLQYGKLLLLLIESDYSYFDVNAALQASFSGVMASGHFDASGEYKQLASASRIRVMTVGGQASNVIGILDGNPDKISDYLSAVSADKKGATAAPLFVQFKFLKDGSNASIVTATDPYRVRRCYTIEPGNRVISKPIYFSHMILPELTSGSDGNLGHGAYRVDLEAHLIARNQREVWASFKVLLRDTNSPNTFSNTEARYDKEILLDKTTIPPGEQILRFVTEKTIKVSFWVPGIDHDSYHNTNLPVYVPHGSPVTITPDMFIGGIHLEPDDFIRQIVANSAHDWDDFPADGSFDRNFIKVYLNDIQVETKKIEN